MQSGLLQFLTALCERRVNAQVFTDSYLKHQLIFRLGVARYILTHEVRMKLARISWVVLFAAQLFAQVNVSAPKSGQTVSNPVHIVATASSTQPITATKIYVDNVQAFSGSGAAIDASLTMAVGNRNVVVQAWDATGTVLKSYLNLNVIANGVTINSPADGVEVSNSVHIVAQAASTNAITATAVDVDNTQVFSAASGSIDIQQPLQPGTHNIVVQAWDSTGAVFKATRTVVAQSLAVNVVSPSDSASVSSPVEVDATAAGQNAVTAMAVYADGQKVAGSSSGSLTSAIALTSGAHTLNIQAWDSAGNVTKVTRTVTVTASAPTSTEDFTIVALPDTQFYSRWYPSYFTAQTNWIVNNLANLNIKMVLGLGDIVDGGGEPTQWANAVAAYDILDGKVPYHATIGNHDYDANDPASRQAHTVNFNKSFGPARYANKSWYRGNYNGSNENFYSVVNIGGKDFLFMSIEFYPRDTVLNWAGSIVAANPDKEVIIATHSFMFPDNTRVGHCDPGTKDDFGVPSDNDGDQTWQKFVSKYPNISMILSGHIVYSTGVGRRADYGVNGNLVNEILSDYQSYGTGGDGWLRILRFHPSKNTVDVTTYSPVKNAYLTDPANQFTIKWHNDGVVTGKGKVEGKVREITGCTPRVGATVKYNSLTATTDASGFYSIATTAPSTGNVTATVSGMLSSTTPTKIDDGLSANSDVWSAAAGVLTGRLTHASGAPISGAAVTAAGGVLGTTASVKTDANGYYTFGYIPVGSYTVTTSAAKSGSTVTAGATTTTNLKLP
jgi:predicted MPP superfamily phosphohydrolase